MKTKQIVNIALDGPSGAGKSTLSKALAKELGLIYVDTGAMYRAIGLFALRQNVETNDSASVIPLLDSIKIDLIYKRKEQRILLNGEDVSEKIREHAVSAAASDVSAIPEVRHFLLDLQRSIAESNSVIMDGRDIGTVILPNADLKLFLTATAEERAMRRYKELIERGQKMEYETVLSDMLKRDRNDEMRDHAPLKPAPDAVLLDTTGNSFSDTFALIRQVIKDRLNDVF
ncbi:MAG: (d)CMP kinase [Clostridiales bacterium]|nr:(d)CMP kinase [Clostridiales bacterium]